MKAWVYGASLSGAVLTSAVTSISCGADHRVADELPAGAQPSQAGGSPSEPVETQPESLIIDPGSPTPISGDAGAAAPAPDGVPSAGPRDDVLLEPEAIAPTGAAMTPGPEGDGVEPPLPPAPLFPPALELPSNVDYPFPGVLLDDRSPAPPAAEPREVACSEVSRLVYQGQRTTVGQGVQLRVALLGPSGLPLDASVNADCLSLTRSDGVAVSETHGGAPATNALTALLVQPAQTVEETEALRHALLQLFVSRPRGERVAVYRWGAAIEQVIGLTSHRDRFSDGLATLVESDDEPADAGVAVTSVQEALLSVGDDAHAWARNVVVVAPRVIARDVVEFERDVNVIWAVDASGVSGFTYVDTSAEDPSPAMGHVSARLNAIRDAGFVTFGVCGDGSETAAVVTSGQDGATLPVALKESLSEEQTGECDPERLRAYEFTDTQLVELSFTEEERQVYDQAVDERDDTVDFTASVRLSPEHAPTAVTANLRGGTSLQQCADNRMNLSIDLDGGRERFFYPESSGTVGSDEFYLTAMCLDPMYVNQLSMDRLMASLGMFVSGTRLVELRVDGESQGVYLLMEQVKEALVRTQSELVAVLRRRAEGREVKFPGADDVAGQEMAAELFDGMITSARDLPGDERLAALAPQLDLHRYMFFVAVQSAIENADWGDEPTFFATSTLPSSGAPAIFQVNGWDPDDVLLGRCSHQVLEDRYELTGCAEHPLDRAIFGADREANTVLDDDVYAMYVEALSVVLSYLTEERFGSYYDQTVEELGAFIDDPAIVSVMPDWANEDEPRVSVQNLVAERKASFAEHRAFLLEQIESYRASR